MKFVLLKKRTLDGRILKKYKVTEIVIVNTIIQNMTCWEKWPIQNLSLYYTSYMCPLKLPPIPSLTSLSLFMSDENEFLDLKSNPQLTSCMILSHIKLNICSYLSSELKSRIKSSNAVLADNLMKDNEGMKLKKAMSLFRDISYKVLYATSAFQFSKGIIYDDSFNCDCFCISNISEQHLETVGRMITIIINHFTKTIDDSSPDRPRRGGRSH